MSTGGFRAVRWNPDPFAIHRRNCKNIAFVQKRGSL
jgi:hypothetical protein